MSTTAREDMATRIERAKKQVKAKGADALSGLEKTAASLGLSKLATPLAEVNKHFKADTFKLMVVGRQKTGKSTFVNATLGRVKHPVPEWFAEPMPVGDLPTTAILTRVMFAAQPSVTAWKFDNTPEKWDPARYEREAKLRETEARNREVFEHIREFEVGFPAQLLESGVTYIDSPGTDEHPKRTAITTAAIAECDAVIVVYSSFPPPGMEETRWVKENILDGKVRVFTIVNRFNGRALDDRFKSLIWEKLIRTHGSNEPEYAGQDFTARDIYFVDALRALDAKKPGQGDQYASSGLELFEKRLTDFLLNERYETHVSRFVNAGEQHAADIARHVAQQRAALQADHRKLQEIAKTIEPKFRAIDAKREKVRSILERYRREAVRELALGYEQMMAELRRDLYGQCENQSIPCLDTLWGSIKSHFSSTKPTEEANQIIRRVVIGHVNAWSKNPPEKPGAQQILEPIVRRLVNEVAAEVTEIQSEFQNFHYDLTGWNPGTDPEVAGRTRNRVIGIVAGVLLQDVGLMFGGAGGLRGLGGTFGGYLAGALAAAMLGLTGPVALGLIVLVGLFGGIASTRVGLEKRIWKERCEKWDGVLRDSTKAGRAEVEAQGAKLLGQVETAVLADLDQIIEQEQQNIRKVLDLNGQEQADKARSLTALDAADTEVAARRKELQNVLLLARQAR